MPVTGTYDLFVESVERCRQLLEASGIQPIGDPFARYFSDSEKVSADRQSWEVGFPVAAGSSVAAPLEVIHVSERQVASSTVDGIKNTDLVWQVFIESVLDQGLIPAYPPAMEVFKASDDDHPVWWHTELQIQVFHPEVGYPGLEITIEESEPMVAIVLPMTGSYVQQKSAIEQLDAYVESKGILPAGDIFGLYYSDASVVSPSEYYWEIGYPIDEITDIEPPYVIRQLDGGSAATATISGPYDMENPWAPFYYQVITRGYLPFLQGPAMEVWHNAASNAVHDPFTEMRLPVIKAEEFAEGMIDWGQQLETYWRALEDSVRTQNPE